MYEKHTSTTARRVSVGAMSRRQLSVLLDVLAPYRGEPITAPVMELAARLARLSALESMEAAS